MENNGNKQAPGKETGKREDAIINLFFQLQGLEKHVKEILNNRDNQRLAVDIGIMALSKKYPALSSLLYGIGNMQGMKNPHASPTPAPGPPASADTVRSKEMARRNTLPEKKKSRGIK